MAGEAPQGAAGEPRRIGGRGLGVIRSFTGPHAFLSNFHASPLAFRGFRFPTVEHAFQSAKALDWETQVRIAQAGSPGEAKRLGGPGGIVALRPDWEAIKSDVMLELLRLKFANRRLALLLLETGEAELVEGNSHGDAVWGMVRRDGEWVGRNMLGQLLEQVRGEVRQRMRTSRHWIALVEVAFRERGVFALESDRRRVTYEMWVGADTEEEARGFVEEAVARVEDVASHHLRDLFEATAGDPGVVRMWPA